MDVNVGLSVAVHVDEEDAEALAHRGREAGFPRDVGERAVSAVAKQAGQGAGVLDRLAVVARSAHGVAAEESSSRESST